jgi:hypothetical protein
VGFFFSVEGSDDFAVAIAVPNDAPSGTVLFVVWVLFW